MATPATSESAATIDGGGDTDSRTLSSFMIKLTAVNYLFWAFRMKRYLSLKKLWSIVEAAPGVYTRDLKEKDETAFYILSMAISDEFLPILMSCDTAAEAWAKLKADFQSASEANINFLRRKLSSLRIGHTETVVQYFSRGRALWQELLATGEQIRESAIVSSLLEGLSEKFAPVYEVLVGLTGLTINSAQNRLVIF